MGRAIKYGPGFKSGRLTIVERTDIRKGSSCVCNCVCDCGNPHEVTIMSLINNPNNKGCPACAAKSKSETRAAKAGRIVELVCGYRTEIIDAYMRGESGEIIADRHGITRQAVYQILTRFASEEVMLARFEAVSKGELIAALGKMPVGFRRRVFFHTIKKVNG